MAQGTGRAITPSDGSSPSKAIAIAAKEIRESVGVHNILDVLGPDAFVVAVRGSIGVQNIPGWTKIPGLKHLGKDAKVGYLAATLTPIDISDHYASPLQSTVFLSITGPDGTPLAIITTKIADLKNMEAGLPIKNKAYNLEAPLPRFEGNVVLFSNWRLGPAESVASANGGILFRAPELKETARRVKGFVKSVIRAVQAAQVTAGAAAAPETGGSSLAAAALSAAVWEFARGTLYNSLDGADWYLGVAWRVSAGAKPDQQGVTLKAQKGPIEAGILGRSVTLKAQKGPFEGKWVTFKIADIPAAIFESKVPNFEIPNADYLNGLNLKPEIRNALATHLVNHDAKVLFRQLANYLRIGIDDNDSDYDLIGWFNKCDPSWLERFTALRINELEQPGSDGRYSLTPSSHHPRVPFRVVRTIPDLISVLSVPSSTIPRMPDNRRGR